MVDDPQQASHQRLLKPHWALYSPSLSPLSGSRRNYKSYLLPLPQCSSILVQAPQDWVSIDSNNWEITWRNLRGKPFNNWLTWEALLLHYFCVIWINKNDNNFNNKNIPISTHTAISLATEFTALATNHPIKPTNHTTIAVKWNPLAQGTLCLT